MLAAQEGIITGVSGGLTFAVSTGIAEKAAPGTTILCILPDTAERCMTTPLFKGLPDDMTDEEVVLSKSTLGYQLDG